MLIGENETFKYKVLMLNFRFVKIPYQLSLSSHSAKHFDLGLVFLVELIRQCDKGLVDVLALKCAHFEEVKAYLLCEGLTILGVHLRLAF